MTHLKADEFVDAIDGALTPTQRAHLDTCASCRREVDELTLVLSDVRAVNIAEPSPLFWEHFAERVHMAVAVEGAAPTVARRWFEWPVLAPLSALALLVFALVWSVPQGSSRETPSLLADVRTVTAPATGPGIEERWAMVFDLVGEVDLDTAMESGFIGRPGAAEAAVRQLSPDEQVELMRLLQQELRSGG